MILRYCRKRENKSMYFIWSDLELLTGRMDEVALVGSSSQGCSKTVNFERARRLAMKHIEAFVLTFSDPQMFSMAASSSGAAALSQIAEVLCIPEAGNLRCRFDFVFH
jgi:hypothetical protein